LSIIAVVHFEKKLKLFYLLAKSFVVPEICFEKTWEPLLKMRS